MTSENSLDLQESKPCEDLSIRTTKIRPALSRPRENLTMSAMAEVLDPFIEKTGRTTAGSHSLSGQTMVVTSDWIFFFKYQTIIFH